MEFLLILQPLLLDQLLLNNFFGQVFILLVERGELIESPLLLEYLFKLLLLSAFFLQYLLSSCLTES